MASTTCMNAMCGAATTSAECHRGWTLRSGESAALCDKCGSAYEQTIFCDVFHSKDSGWRECTSCGKRLHCGCIVSISLLELLDGGGINCINCAVNSGLQPRASDEKPNGFDMSKAHNDLRSTSVGDQSNGASVDKIKFMRLGSSSDGIDLRHLIQSQKDDRIGSFGKMKQEDNLASAGEAGSACFSNFSKPSRGSSQFAKLEVGKSNMGAKDVYESLAQTNLSITLGTPITNAFSGAAIDERESSRTSSPFQQGPRSRHLMPKPPKPVLATGLEANANMVSQIRVARPPAEGRGRSQLLPRYWPRITDQELQQISGDSNSTIVPLFEKVLSASDAGRIGRLVLPKACAEAYFPPISQPEGLPLRIQDIKGKEWVFQFRFWPNNNSRMYVLEGVTPCIQSMQLQAGDTVTFSRMEPEGKLVMGFRKASNSVAMQETKPSAIPNGPHPSETFFSGVFENLPIVSGYSGLLQSLKGSTDPHLHALSKHMSSTNAEIAAHFSEKHEGRSLSSGVAPERKRARNIGSKSKRLLIDSQDALELKLTWEEAQDLLRPPPSIKPSIVKIEDHEFEEYEEPPIFGKSSIFVVGSTGGQEQWAQCDSCMKWRRLPVDFLLPPKWTCVDNCWDQIRCSCSAPDELTPRELENLLRLHNEFKKRRIAVSHKATPEHEASGLDALANAAILGDNVGDPDATISVATTTKHPRHRPGCSCIVCIQPPSGKGKHKPTCTCNVCMTVKRRFKTLMIRKKKRQLEREAEIAQRNQHAWPLKDTDMVADVDNASGGQASPQLDSLDREVRSESKSQSNNVSTMSEAGKGQIDLNFQPEREEELQQGMIPNISMMGLLQVANLPLETYLKQNGLTSLVNEQPASSASQAPQQAMEESEEQPQENLCEGEDRESVAEEHCETEKKQNTQ